jgi:hypothetical protein
LNEVLVDSGKFDGESLVQAFDDFVITLHDTKSLKRVIVWVLVILCSIHNFIVCEGAKKRQNTSKKLLLYKLYLIFWIFGIEMFCAYLQWFLVF